LGAAKIWFAGSFTVAISSRAIPRIQMLTMKNKMLDAHSPGTNDEVPKNSSR